MLDKVNSATMKISVTTIEAYRNYLNDLIKLEDLLERISGKFVPSRYIELGTAFHDILENLDERYIPTKNVFKANNGIEFNEDVISKCYQVINKEAKFEVKATKIYNIDSEPIEIVAKVDQILGNYIYENKTCWGVFDFEKYYNSCQWKFYLDIFEADKVFYNVFLLSDKKSGFELRNIEQFSFDFYPNLFNDINYLLYAFYDFVCSLDLKKYFQN